MSYFVDIHTHKADSENISIYSYMAGSGAPLPEVIYSTGIHPWKLDGAKTEWLDDSITSLTVAIGETGLDFAIETPHEKQEKWFRFQLSRAQELALPVIIHCVKAYNEVIAILKEYKTVSIIHGFTGSEELAEQLLKAGFYLSFGANLLYSPKTQAAIKSVPLDRLFLETDANPISIEDIYSAAAEYTGLSAGTLKEAIYDNYKRVFPK